MVKEYTEIWNGFQFRSPVYIDGHFEPNKYDLVKWQEHVPYEVTDWETGKKKTSTRSCFTIGMLIWNEKEHKFKFESCGVRYLEYRIAGLEQFVLDFCKTIKKDLQNDDMVFDIATNIKEVKVYTDIWNDFQFLAMARKGEQLNPYEFNLVKWMEREPCEITDWCSGEKRMSTKDFVVIGTLVWDPREPGFEFESNRLRYLELREDNLEKFILDFCKDMEKGLRNDDWDDEEE